MEQTTGRHYMITALKRQYADRLPTTVLTGPYCSRLTRYSVREILTDARKSAEAHLAFHERFRPDSIVVYNDIYMEAEAVGCELEFPEGSISRLKRAILAEKADLARLKVPDPRKEGRLPYFLELCERVSSQVRKEATVGVGQAGPWNLAAHLRGLETLLLDSLEDPGFVHDLMKFTTEVVRSLGDALLQAGFLPSLGEAAASCSVISPKIYKDLIKPYHAELCSHFRSKKAALSMHICGYIDPIMQDVLETGISFISLDAPSSLRKLVDLAGGKATIMGNVPTTLFATGEKEEMEAAIRACVDMAAEGSGYILCSGCEIPFNSTEDRVAHYFEYAHRYGQEFMREMKKRRPELFPG